MSAITFSSLFGALVEEVKKIDQLPEVKADNDGEVMPNHIFRAVKKFIDKLSPSQKMRLAECAGDRLAGGSSEIFNGEGWIQVEDEMLAVYIMLYTHKGLAYDPTGNTCEIENGLDISELSVAKWEQLEYNSWDWFSSEFWSYGVIEDVEHLFLLKMTHEESTEVETYALYKTSDKDTALMASYRVAQFFLGGVCDTECRCFVNGESKQYPLEPMEISQAEWDTYKKLNLRDYCELQSIPADDNEVAELWHEEHQC